MNYITQETAQLIEACKALSDYVHAEQSSTDGQVTYSTSTINHHVFQIRAALAQPAKPMEDFDAWQNNPYTKVLEKSIAEDYTPKADKAAQPDCRTCNWRPECNDGMELNCVNGSEYEAAPAVVLWRTE